MTATLNPKLKLKLTIDDKFKKSINRSKHVPVSTGQLTPPAKVPCSPSGDEPASPESANISLYEDMVVDVKPTIVALIKAATLNTTSSSTSSVPTAPQRFAAADTSSQLADLDHLTEVFDLASNWAELHSLTSLPLGDVDAVDSASSSSATHFEFPDYTTPEVSDILGVGWLENSLITTTGINC